MRYSIFRNKLKNALDIRYKGFEDKDTIYSSKYCDRAQVSEGRFLNALEYKIEAMDTIQHISLEDGTLSLTTVEFDEMRYKEGFNVTYSNFDLVGFGTDDPFYKELDYLIKSYAGVQERTKDHITRMLISLGKYRDKAPKNKADFILRQYMKWSTLTSLSSREEAKSVVQCLVDYKNNFVDSLPWKIEDKITLTVERLVIPAFIGTILGSALALCTNIIATLPILISIGGIALANRGLKKYRTGKVARIVDGIIGKYMEKYDLDIDDFSKVVRYEETKDDKFISLVKREIKCAEKVIDTGDVLQELDYLLEDYYAALDERSTKNIPVDKSYFYKNLNRLHREVVLKRSGMNAFDDLRPNEKIKLNTEFCSSNEYLESIRLEALDIIENGGKGYEYELLRLRSVARKYASKELKMAKRAKDIDRMEFIKRELVRVETTINEFRVKTDGEVKRQKHLPLAM